MLCKNCGRSIEFNKKFCNTAAQSTLKITTTCKCSMSYCIRLLYLYSLHLAGMLHLLFRFFLCSCILRLTVRAIASSPTSLEDSSFSIFFLHFSTAAS